MQALTFWKTITMDHANLLEQVLALLAQHQIRYCIIGGQAVNAYGQRMEVGIHTRAVEPIHSDL
jgi:hypothetical protein